MARRESFPSPSAPPMEVEAAAAAAGQLIRQLSVGSVQLEEPWESLISTVELTISAQNLLNRDVCSKSDPVCILYLKDKSTNWIWCEVERTECIKNDLNPTWAKKIQLQYSFEERQMLRFMVYDFDGSSQNLSQHDFLGKMECALPEIVSVGKIVKKLNPPELYREVMTKESELTVVAEELTENRNVLSVKVSCVADAIKMSIFGVGEAAPCLVISKQLDDGSWVLLHRTDRFDRPFDLRVSSLTSGKNLERPLKFQLYQKKKNTKWRGTKLVGEFKTNYLHLIEQYKAHQNSFRFWSVPKQNRMPNLPEKVATGTLEILSLNVNDQPTFLDHISRGLKLSFTIAIDFTASNGDPARTTSLHYRYGAGTDNPYVLAIKTVGEILSDYSSDHKIAAYGFGAKGFPAGNKVSHCFPINFKMKNPFVDGIEGVLSAYYRVIKRIKLFGPTHFASVIQEQIHLTRNNLENTYHVLIILTDGVLCDPVGTKDAIVRAADLPISIIIIGIGGEDFKEMENLDCDGGFLRNSKGVLASRDIVQFVELKKFADPKSITPITPSNKAAFTKAVLTELPFQVCEWASLFAK